MISVDNALPSWAVIEGDCIEVMAAMDEASVDAVVTDPPYSLGFMGKAWDRNLNHGPWAAEALRVIKPGGHLLAFGGTRTYHRLTCALEDAGFEIRDCLAWLYGSGFPKSLDVSKALDKAARAVREVVGSAVTGRAYTRAARRNANGGFESGQVVRDITTPATPDAERWQGWGTALKPAFEPIVLARKPLSERNVAENVLRWGTGAVNVDGCRVETAGRPHREARTAQENDWEGGGQWKSSGFGEGETTLGRWPANVVLDEEAAAMLDEQSGSGGASRFFYVPKADRAERERGLEHRAATRMTDEGYGSIQTPTVDRAVPRENWQPHEARNPHPTVKPVALMAWLCRLVAPPGGTVLDPFTGSGSTGIAALREGFSFVGIEREPEYVEIARARIVGDAPLFNVEAGS